MQTIRKTWSGGLVGKLIIGCGGLIVLIFLCGIPLAFLGALTSDSDVTPTPESKLAELPVETATPAVPTDTPPPQPRPSQRRHWSQPLHLSQPRRRSRPLPPYPPTRLNRHPCLPIRPSRPSQQQRLNRLNLYNHHHSQVRGHLSLSKSMTRKSVSTFRIWAVNLWT
jgi:hypothetical protein